MAENDASLRLYMRLVAIETATDLSADKRRVKKTAELFLSVPVLAAATKAQVGDRRPKAVTAKTRATLVATGKHAEVQYFDQPGSGRGTWMSVDLDSELCVRIIIKPEALTSHLATALDDLTSAFVQAAEVWRGIAVVRQGFIKVEYAERSPPFARLRFPRETIRFPARSLVTFLDAGDPARAEDFAALARPRPAHATVTTHGGLVQVRWAKTLDPREIAQASTWHDCWIRRTVTTPDEDFNEHGDELVDAGEAEKKAPLTLYNSWSKVGFKAVLVTPRGKLEASALAEARAVLKAKTLRGGQEVKTIWIVVPLREHAVAVHERVVSAGFEGALYPGEGSEFWDPAPKGPWLSKSTDTR